MKKYRFKRNEPNLGSSDKQNGDELSRYDSLHDLHDPKFDIMHIGDEPNFEKLVEDEVSSCNSLHDLHDPNLMQPPQINTGETLQDCIDFDELLNDFHSTAANAQLLRPSLSGSSEPTPDM